MYQSTSLAFIRHGSSCYRPQAASVTRAALYQTTLLRPIGTVALAQGQPLPLGYGQRPSLIDSARWDQQLTSSQYGRRSHNTKSSSSCGVDGKKERFPLPDKDKELELASMQTRITSFYQEGNFTSALKASKDLLKKTEDHFGHMHPATASAYNNVGLMHKLLGDFVEARANYNYAMRIYGQVVGRDHASYAMALHNLGALNRTQIHLDADLKASERLSLVEIALEYLEEALAIRRDELGDEHPHTVATQSTIGSTLAAQVLYQHKCVVGKDDTQKREYVSLNPDSVTKRGWDAAEVYLRDALKTAVTAPRGKNVQRKKPKKKKIKLKKQTSSVEDATNPTSATIGIGDILTLSAAAAAQNLAVFLKSRAVTQQPYNQTQLKEAHEFYNQVIQVRSQLLPAQHPDLYSTQHSLAELLEAMGGTEAANELRQKILDTYDPPTSSSSLNQPTSQSSSSSLSSTKPQQVEQATSKQ